ncbi:MAG: primosomal protein N' [Christensenellaceae bacterium]|jgi:primosomal protein N' (replication factor Y)|nr:primosomal protein N' [Christensenellaceae bacterium]
MFVNVLTDGDKLFTYSADDDMQIGSFVVVPLRGKETDGFVVSFADKPKFETKPIKKKIVRLIPEAIEIYPEICNRFKLKKFDVLKLFLQKGKPLKNNQMRTPAFIKKQDKPVVLTAEQQNAVNIILSANGVHLLHGVTGSGKTEVYMHAIENVLSQNSPCGKTALMLVPEIGLTPQVLSNFKARFGNIVAMLHSGLSDGERFDEWQRVNSGEAKIVIGARSAVFAPLKNIGIIIIDEEHDGSYQSESNPRYFTHDIAAMRADYNNCPLVLGSATPSIETYFNVTNNLTQTFRLKKVCGLIELKNRVNDQQMPDIQIIDMCNEIRSGNGGIFSKQFLESLFLALKSNKTAMVFLNRRGYSQSIRCKKCGWVANCQNCDVNLVYHADEERLKCHYCDARWTVPNQCPNCGGDYLKYGAMGTQKIVRELQAILQKGGLNIPIFRMDTDNTKTKGALLKIIDDFSKNLPSVLVGTQIIAKGHHFPDCDIVCVVDADNGLHIPDYRSAERTFSLITQVAGRAGRESNAGKVFVQTYMPNHYVYKLVKDYDYLGLYKKEINARMTTKFPPFSQIIRVLVSGEIDTKIKSLIEKMMKEIRSIDYPFIFLSAMVCPNKRIKNKFRYQILMRVKKENEEEITSSLFKIIEKHKTRNINTFLEINPSSLA